MGEACADLVSGAHGSSKVRLIVDASPTGQDIATSKAGALNAVSAGSGMAAAAPIMAPVADAGIKACAIDNPDCEACQ